MVTCHDSPGNPPLDKYLQGRIVGQEERWKQMETGTAIDLRPGDVWSWFSQGGVKVTATELTDDGRLEIVGRIVGGRDHGIKATWHIPLTDKVEYER